MNYFYYLFIFTFLFSNFRAEEEGATGPSDPDKESSHSEPSEHSELSEERRTSFYAEWEQSMRDYEPDFVYMIPIEYKKKEIFYENIKKTPARVRGAVLLDEEKEENIDFQIYGPQDNVVYMTTTSHKIFDFTINEPGSYKIIFHNNYVNTDLRVTFTMNCGQNVILKREHLNLVDQKIQSVSDFMKKYGVEFKMRRNVHSERFKSKLS
jgi:hypothetical protein